MPASKTTRTTLAGSTLAYTTPGPKVLATPFRQSRTPEQIEHDRVQSRQIAASSLALSKLSIATWLDRSCLEHEAAKGEYCWPAVRGLCSARVQGGAASSEAAES